MSEKRVSYSQPAIAHIVRGNGDSYSIVDEKKTSWIDSLSGVQNPGYRAKIRKGLDASSPYTAVKRSITSSGAISSTRPGIGKNSPIGKSLTMTGTPDLPGFIEIKPTARDIERARSDAAANFYQAVSDAHSEFKGAVEALEFPKTASMVVSKLSIARRVMADYSGEVLKFKKRFAKNPKQAMAMVRKLYLEYTYGWAPAISSVQSLMKELDKDVTNLRVGVSAIGTVRIDGSTNVENTSWHTSPLGDVTVISKRYADFSVRYKGSLILAPIGYAGLDAKPTPLGFNPEEFLPTAYELFPFSFVLDYVANVGGYLTALAYHSARFQYVYMNTKTISTHEQVANGKNNTSFVTNSSGTITTYSRLERTTRALVPSVPEAPTLMLSKEVNMKQYLNVMVLFQQLASRPNRF